MRFGSLHFGGAIMSRAIFPIFIFLIVELLSANKVCAQVQYGSISAGQEKGWFLDEGSTIVVTYCPNGSSETLAWKQNWFNWLMSDPLVVINIYYTPGAWCPAVPIYTTSADPFYKNFPLLKTNGMYFFTLTAYRASAPVYLKIY